MLHCIELIVQSFLEGMRDDVWERTEEQGAEIHKELSFFSALIDHDHISETAWSIFVKLLCDLKLNSLQFC